MEPTGNPVKENEILNDRRLAKTVAPRTPLAQAARDAGISLEAARRIPVPSPITNSDAYRIAILKHVTKQMRKAASDAVLRKVLVVIFQTENPCLLGYA